MLMTRLILIEALNNTFSKKMINDLSNVLVEQGFSIIELINLSFHQNQSIAFRAAWILEDVYFRYPQYFLMGCDLFLNKYADQENSSAQRHYAKILAHLTQNKGKLNQLFVWSKDQEQQLIDTNFAWLIEVKVPVAVKSHCLNVLANFAYNQAWIKEELLQTIDFLIDKESIAFYAKAKQIRKQLKKINA